MTSRERAATRSQALSGDEKVTVAGPDFAGAGGGSGELLTLSDAIEAAKGTDLDFYDMDKVWELADLLEPLDPAEIGWHVEIAEAAMFLFGDVGLGPADHAVRWLWYVQNATTSLLGPWDERTLTANRVLARTCWTLGLYDEAAAAWQTAVVSHEHHDDPDAADEARIDRAVCLYGLGRGREAVTLLRMAWGARRMTGRAARRVGAALPLVYIEMLRLCWRREEARTVRRAAAKDIPESVLLRQEMFHSYGQVLDARTHDASCTSRELLAQSRLAGGLWQGPGFGQVSGMAESAVVDQPTSARVSDEPPTPYLGWLLRAGRVAGSTERDVRCGMAPP